MKKRNGISLTEYGLIAGIITIVALPALLSLGQNVSKATESILTTRNQPSVSAAKLQAGKPSPAASQTTSILQGVPAVLSTSDLTRTVQTVGVNGTTVLLADSLTTLSNQLLQAGSIDETTYNAIVALANQGHTLAKIEASVESAAKAAGSGGGSAFYSTSVALNGKQYSGPELVSMLNRTSPDIKAFQELQSTVLNSTSITDPALKSVLTQLSNNILNLADASAESGDWIGGDGDGIDSYESFIDDIPDMLADYASKTTVNSNEICATQSKRTACTK